MLKQKHIFSFLCICLQITFLLNSNIGTSYFCIELNVVLPINEHHKHKLEGDWSYLTL